MHTEWTLEMDDGRALTAVERWSLFVTIDEEGKTFKFKEKNIL
jgi:hypothetical protein